jgi:hypothetical protein
MKTTLMNMFIRLVAPILCFSLAAMAQPNPRVAIVGRVSDDSTGAFLQNVNVFVAQTTLGCNTDESGRFEIKNVPLGSFEIVASRLGYALRSIRVEISEFGSNSFDIRLHPMPITVREVVVSANEPVEWKRQLSTFTKLFLGTTLNADKCKILNPEVLDFNELAGFFSATARKPLEIENRALGYHIQFILSVFKLEPGNSTFELMSSKVFGRGMLTLEGMPHYTDLTSSDPAEVRRWNEARMRAFKGSFRHFLVALTTKHLQDEGYVISSRPSLAASRGQGREVTEDSLVFVTSEPATKLVRFTEFLQVEYKRESEEPGYDLLRLKDSDAQTSWIELNYDAIKVNPEGLINEWFPTKLYGYWAWTRLADSLPLDYVIGNH